MVHIPRSWLTRAAIFGMAVFVVRELTLEIIFGSAVNWLRGNLGLAGDFLGWRWSGIVMALAAAVGIWLISEVWARRAAPAVIEQSGASPASEFSAEKGLLDLFWKANRHRRT